MYPGILGQLDEKNSIAEFLRTITCFRFRIQEELTDIRQGSANLSEVCSLKTDTEHFCKQVGHSDAHHLHLSVQFHSMQDTLDHKTLKFSALFAEFYILPNKRHQHPSDINSGQDTKAGLVLDYCAGIPFQQRRCNEDGDFGVTFWFRSLQLLSI